MRNLQIKKYGRILKLSEIANYLSANIVGDSSHEILGLATLTYAKENQISFFSNSKYRHLLKQTKAGAVLIKSQDLPDCTTNALVVTDPYIAYAKISHLFKSNLVGEVAGIHPSAIIAASASIAEDVSIGPYSVIEANAVIAARAEIGAQVMVGAGAVIGEESKICANVTLYPGVSIGKNVLIHSGAVIGSDGFGFANEQGKWIKIAQIGSVRIADDVEIGASTTIDRGAIEDTIIGKGVIIDNQVQVAHNVIIGDHTAIAGCVGIAGSTQIGKYCTIAGAAGIAGHLKICDYVHIGMQAQVTNSITQPGYYASGTGLSLRSVWRKNVIRFRQLDTFVRQFRDHRRNS